MLKRSNFVFLAVLVVVAFVFVGCTPPVGDRPAWTTPMYQMRILSDTQDNFNSALTGEFTAAAALNLVPGDAMTGLGSRVFRHVVVGNLEDGGFTAAEIELILGWLDGRDSVTAVRTRAGGGVLAVTIQRVGP